MVTPLKGIAVFLRTSNDVSDAGTDDHIYVGLVGTGGGREFALATPEEDFEPQPSGQDELFLFGTIWDSTVTSNPSAKKPNASEPGGNNDPARFLVDMELVDYVYLRKQGSLSLDGDDEYALRSVTVLLYGNGPVAPTARQFDFVMSGEKPWLWLANENGHVVYLQDRFKLDQASNVSD
jgi:hypothetical protein